MSRLLAAFRFLTVLPYPSPRETTKHELAASLVFFPVVGLTIGGCIAAAAFGLAFFLPPLPTAALTIVLLAMVSGGLHLDGLSDSADGLFSSRPPQRMLEIMRDSRVGPMGVSAIVCVLLIKFACLATIPSSHLWQTLLLIPLAGRCALVLTIAVVPYARSDSGLATEFYTGRRKLAAIWGLVLLGTISWLILKTAGLVASGGAIVATLLVAIYVYRKIGGSTGDTLGASCEIAETAIALMLSIPISLI